MRTHLSKARSPGNGFTLIEMAIVLGIVGVLGAGLFRLLSTSNQQNKDLVTAQQHQSLINAVTGYLASANGQLWIKTLGPPNLGLPAANLLLPTNFSTCAGSPTGFCDYLPPGFISTTTNPYGQDYQIQVLKDSTPSGTIPITYSFMIIATTPGIVVPDADGGRISSLIGGDGGFIYSSPLVCGVAAPNVCGTMGAWSVIATAYGFTVPQAPAGSVVSRTFISSASAAGSAPWLARLNQGDTAAAGSISYTYNTMSTDLYMGVPAAGTYDLYMYPDTVYPANPKTGGQGVNNIHLFDGSLLVEGATSAPATVGSIDFANSQGGAINLHNSGQIIGLSTSANFGPSISLQVPAGYMNGNGTGTPVSLITLGAGCTILNALYPSCLPALTVSTGDVSVGGELLATKILSTSDERLKINIQPIKTPLNDLMKIEAVSFTLKESGSKGMGVTAQNLEKTYPELVSENGGKKYVDYNGLIGPLIGAVQELKDQNDVLRAQLQQQKLREDTLENEIKKKSLTP